MVARLASLVVHRDGIISMAQSVYHLRCLPRFYHEMTPEFINDAFIYNRECGVFASDLQTEVIADLCSVTYGMHYMPLKSYPPSPCSAQAETLGRRPLN